MFSFEALPWSVLSGYGSGTAMPGPMTFTYGLSLPQAEKYLHLPKGKVIRQTDKGLELGSV